MPTFDDVPPLDWQTPIANNDGTPSPQFQRLWQLIFKSGQGQQTDIDGKVDKVVPSVDNVVVKFDGVSGGQQGSNLTSVDNGSLMLTLPSTAGYEGTVYSNTANQNITNLFSRARGTVASPIKTNASDILGSIRFRGYNGTSFVQFGQLRFTSTSAGDAATPTGTFTVTVGANSWTFDNTTGFTSPLVINVPDVAYNSVTWDGDLSVPTKNAVRDKFEAPSGVTAGSYTNTNLTVNAQGIITAASNGSGGGGGTGTPVVRSSKISSSSASSYTITWPTGTLAGDTVLFFGGHGFGFNLPTGWTQISNLTGSNFNGAVFSRVLSGADITTGSLTVTTAGSYNGVVCLVTLIGFCQVRGTPAASRNGTGSATIVLASDGSPQTTDLNLYFGSNRSTPGSTNTVSIGTSLQTVNATEASGVLTASSPASVGGVTPTFSYSTAGTGNYQAIVAMYK